MAFGKPPPAPAIPPPPPVPPPPEVPELKTTPQRRQIKTIFGELNTGIMGSQRTGDITQRTLFGGP